MWITRVFIHFNFLSVGKVIFSDLFFVERSPQYVNNFSTKEKGYRQFSIDLMSSTAFFVPLFVMRREEILSRE